MSESYSGENFPGGSTVIGGENVNIQIGYNPLEDSGEYMNKRHLAYFKILITNWRDELLEKSIKTIENLQDGVMDGRVADEDDMTTNEIEVLNELRTRDRYRKLIHKIDRALIAIETGEYGYCEESGEEIGLRRLIARPIATLSVAMQEKREKLESEYERTERYAGILDHESDTE